MKRSLPVVATLLILLAGCSAASRHNWARTGTTADDLARDRYTCMQESRTPFNTSAGASTATGGTEGRFIMLAAARHAQTEANRLFDSCMEAKGWAGVPR